MNTNPPRPLFAYSGPAGPLRHAILRARRLRLMEGEGLITWTHEGKSVKVSIARLMRCVMEEVERK